MARLQSPTPDRICLQAEAFSTRTCEREEKRESWEVENPRRVFLHCLATSLFHLLYVSCVCWLHFSDFYHQYLALLFVFKEDSVRPQPDSSHTVQASNTTVLAQTLQRWRTADSASIVAWSSWGPITRSGERSRTM